MRELRSLAFLFGVSVLAFAGVSRSSLARADAQPETATVVDQEPEDGNAATCSDEGDDCLTKNAPKCCRGLRCVNSVCKK